VVPSAYVFFAQEPPPAPFDFPLLDALVGYLLGALLAEITVRRQKADVPTASLVPREVKDYLPFGLRATLRTTAGLALVLFLIYLVVPARARGTAVDALPPGIVVIPMVLAILVGVEGLQRFIVRRPQPAVESDLLHADDAVRSASVHALAGAGIALELAIISVEVFGIGTIIDIQLLRWTFPWISVTALGAALGSWMYATRTLHWHVQHTQQGVDA
jgi:hypothetical protein